jgi:uncharacterized membrane protein YdjX (TVP38/TMEM64 family)
LVVGLVLFCVLRLNDLLRWSSLLCNQDYIRNVIESSGRAGPLVFLGLQLLQVVVAPIPGDIVVFLGGYLFGAGWGTGLSTLGQLLGSLLNYFIGAFLGKRLLLGMLGSGLYCKCNSLVQGKGAVAIFFLFLLPGFPKDTLCLFLGMARMPIGVYLTVSTAGRMPWLIAMSFQGAAVFEHDYVGFLLSATACSLFALVAYLNREAIGRWIPIGKEAVCIEAAEPDEPRGGGPSVRRETS